jgi:hypothetical protein
MAVKKRCPHCTKKMENIGTPEKPQWVCKNHEFPIYVPPLVEEDEPQQG